MPGQQDTLLQGLSLPLIYMVTMDIHLDSIVLIPTLGRTVLFQRAGGLPIWSRVHPHLMLLLRYVVTLSVQHGLIELQFQGGSFDPWGGLGFDQCSVLLNNEFERVFYKNDYSFGVTIFNLYMVRIAYLYINETILIVLDVRGH